MTTSLNKHSQEFAQDQIKQGHVVLDQMDDWSEHQPSAKAEKSLTTSLVVYRWQRRDARAGGFTNHRDFVRDEG